MSTPARLAAYALGLAAVFGAAVGVGAAVGPVGPASAEPMTGSTADGAHGDAPETGHEDAAGHDEAGQDEAGHDEVAALPAGLQVSEGGYTLALDAATLPAGADVPLAFRILDADGHAVTAFDERHEEDLHLIAVRRDLSGYQHVHPELTPGGTWRVPLDLTPGAWRVLADFAPTTDGGSRTLGADLAVAGEYAPGALPEPSPTAEVDGYTVVLNGQLAAGEESELTLSVSRDGVPVTDLQPYLGAYGHLVVLRAGDLAYLHVHPVDEAGGGAPAPGPHVRFGTTPPSAGTYRLFLDFKHGDVVRTAAFTVEVDAHEETHG
jgi:hypothetical protein